MMNYPWQFDKMILNNQCDSMHDKIMLNNFGDILTKWWRTISDTVVWLNDVDQSVKAWQSTDEHWVIVWQNDEQSVIL